MNSSLRLLLLRTLLLAGALALLWVASLFGGATAVVFRVLAVLGLIAWIVVGIVVSSRAWRGRITPDDPPAPVTPEAIRRQLLYAGVYIGTIVVFAVLALVLSFVIAELELPLRIAGIGLLVLAAASLAAALVGLRRMRRRLPPSDA